MEEVHHLMVRRRFKDGFDGIWLGYDEFYGTRATGRIVMGWHVDKKTGEIVNHYAKEPPELKVLRAREQKAEFNEFVDDLRTLADSLQIDATPEIEEYVVEEPVFDLIETPLSVIDLSNATERYVVTFDWHYGSERMVLNNLEEAQPFRKAVEDKFGHLNPINWKITKEMVVSEDVEWPE